MGDGSRAEKRRARSRIETEQLFAPLFEYAILPNAIIQCGLGDWAEGPVLLKYFSHAEFLAVEPILRYAHEAWRDGFRGPIVQGALWHTTGLVVMLQDFRSRTSMLDTEPRRGDVATHTVTLDDAVTFTRFNRYRMSTLLWMDCEGVELEILKGATKTLQDVTVIVCELKDEPKMAGWPPTPDVIQTICDLGYNYIHRIADNGLFVRKDPVCRRSTS